MIVIQKTALVKAINETTKKHKQKDISTMVPKDYRKGFLAGLQFVKKHIINCRDLHETM